MVIRKLFTLAIVILAAFASAVPALAQEPEMDIVVYDKGRGVKGNGNGKIDGGEQVWIMFYITNRSSVPLEGLSLQVAAKNGRFGKNTLEVPDIAPGKRVRAAARMAAPADPGELRILAELKGGPTQWPPYIYVMEQGDLARLDPSTGQIMASAPKEEEAVQGEAASDLPGAVDDLAEQILAALPESGAKIAVAPFTNLGPTAQQKKLGQIVSELLVTRLSKRPDLTIIERAQLERILEELKLSMLGLTESKNAEHVGKLLGAEAMIVGSVSEVGDQFAVSARQVNVDDGKVAFAKEVLVPQAGTIALSSKYVVQRSKSDSLFRSFLFPGWGQYYNNDDAKGYIFTGLTLGLVGAGVFTHFQYETANENYMAASSKEEARELYEERGSLYNSRNTIFAIAGGVWAVNVIDAFISGISASEVKIEEERREQQASRVKAEVSPVVSVGPDGSSIARLNVRF